MALEALLSSMATEKEKRCWLPWKIFRLQVSTFTNLVNGVSDNERI